jgi:hypothetical protein
MTRQSSTYTEERRTFLKKLAAAGGATAAVAMSSQAAASPDQDLASEATEDRGYHETPHIRNYYRTAKL